MKLTSAVNRRLLKSITGGVLVGVLCISGPSVSSGFPGPPLRGGGPGLPSSLAQGRTVGPHQPAFRGGEGEGRLGGARGHFGGMGSVHNYAQNANAASNRQNFGQNLNAASNRQTANNNGNNSGNNYTANNYGSNYGSNYGYQGYGGGGYGQGSYGSWNGYYAGLATAGAAGVVIGETVASVPEDSTVVVAQGNPYYYSEGVYYAPQGSSSQGSSSHEPSSQGTSYTVVPPPQGAVIPSIPYADSSTTVYGGGQTFTYCNGVFYESTSNGYKITDPPPGVMVTSLPKGAANVTVNGVNYLEFGGVWYQPFYSGSEVIYQTIPNPTA